MVEAVDLAVGEKEKKLVCIIMVTALLTLFRTLIYCALWKVSDFSGIALTLC